jgi:hypothetical protein
LNRNRSKIELSKFSSGATEEKTARKSVRGTKIEENFSIFVPGHLPEEKTALNSVPWDKNRRNFLNVVHGRKYVYFPP